MQAMLRLGEGEATVLPGPDTADRVWLLPGLPPPLRDHSHLELGSQSSTSLSRGSDADKSFQDVSETPFLLHPRAWPNWHFAHLNRVSLFIPTAPLWAGPLQMSME